MIADWMVAEALVEIVSAELIEAGPCTFCGQPMTTPPHCPECGACSADLCPADCPTREPDPDPWIGR